MKKILLGVVGAIILGVVIFLALQKPSHNRLWNDDGKILPQGVWNQDQSSLTLIDIRDWSFDASGATKKEWKTLELRPEEIESVWFITTPFSSFAGIAHTMLMFTFTTGESVLISVEARKEQGETYSAWKGLWNQYELVYLWGTPQDFLVRRAVFDQDPIRMMQLKSSASFNQNLFRDFVEQTNKIYQTPQFYSTIFSNCTNQLAKAANRQKAKTIPPSLSHVLPGYADKTLYDLGFIQSDFDWEETKQKSYVHDFIKENHQIEDWEKSLQDWTKLQLSFDQSSDSQ